jgi:hypothetical protein
MEDAYWRTLRKMQELEQNLSHGGNGIESFSAPPKVQNSVNNWS